MSICKNCGVDLGEGNDICPLCDPEETEPGKIKSPADLFRVSRKETARHLYEMTILLLVSGIIITVAIDAVFRRGMSWSLTSTTCIGYVIAMVSGIYFFYRKPYLMITVSGASTMIFLWLIDMITGGSRWFMSMAFPMVAAATVLTVTVIFLNSLSRYRGLNLLATILLALAIFLVVIEYLTDMLLTSEFTPQWSVVTAASLVIISLIFVFIHFRLKRGRSLGRMFHV
jgi:hypothetical protein